MTRGAERVRPAPGKASAARTVPRPGRDAPALAPARARRAALGLILLLVLRPTGHALARPGDLPEGPITEIRVEGNSSITAEQVRGAIQSRVGAPLDQHTIDTDIQNLHVKKWFSRVEAFYEPDAKQRGYVLIFNVREMPVLKHVEFRG